LKAEKSDRLLWNRKKGVTLVEMVLAVCIVGILSGVVYRIFDRQVSQANSDDKSSKYYMDLGLLIETLNNDLAMARIVHPESDGVSLLVNPDGNPGSITYALKGNTIERTFRGAGKTFEFTNPNRKDSPLIFRVEEMNP